MRTLVTGGAGFVGSHVVDALRADGHSVVVIDNLVTGSRDNLPSAVELVEIDVRNRDAVMRTMQRVMPTVVFHLAAQTLVNSSSSDPIRDAEINVMGTINVVQAAIASRAGKLVFASSGGTVYGNAAAQPVSEAQPLYPISPYGVSKVAGEHYIRVLCGQAGMASTILRYGNVYGPRDIPASHHVITTFVEALLNGERPVIEWDGEQAKDYVYVTDVAAAHVAAISAGDGEAFNIAGGQQTTVNEIFRLVCAAMQVTVEPRRADRRPADVRRFLLDCHKAERMLDWAPAVSLSDGLLQTVAYYRARERQRRMNALTVQ